ncbi:MAG TPA: hypothetical protein VFX27_08040 [Sphingobium sp.]|jgi:hypothetical protein|nr:hypothetical protein [Sphingobium sp.]
MIKKLVLITLIVAAVVYSGIGVRDIENGIAYISRISAQIMMGSD